MYLQHTDVNPVDHIIGDECVYTQNDPIRDRVSDYVVSEVDSRLSLAHVDVMQIIEEVYHSYY